MTAGPLRRIAYSFAGLAAGDFVLVIIQVANNVTRFPRELWWIHLFPPDNQTPQMLGMYTVAPIVSVIAWALAGVPIVLWLSTQEIAGASWPVLISGGSLLGPLSLTLPIVALSRGEHVVELIGVSWIFLLCSAICSGLAFAIHCALVRRYARLPSTPVS
jgi:hypothetical protein